MADETTMEAHRTWEDWAGICIGAVTVLSPWLTGQTGSTTTTMNAVVIGVIIMALGALELVRLHRLEEIALFACGLWLFTSPISFAYGGSLAVVHMALGAIVTLLAVLELWQDWGRTDRDMARHGG